MDTHPEAGIIQTASSTVNCNSLISTQIFVHVALLRGKASKLSDAKARNRALLEKVFKEGPASLARSDRAHLLRDTESMVALQRRMWPMSKRYSAREPALTQVHHVNAMKHKAMPVTDRSPAVEAHLASV